MNTYRYTLTVDGVVDAPDDKTARMYVLDDFYDGDLKFPTVEISPWIQPDEGREGE